MASRHSHPSAVRADATARAAVAAQAQAAAGSGQPAQAAPLRSLSVAESIRSLRQSMATLHQLAATSRGPHGGVKLLHLNPLSPSVTLSQSSSVLTTSLAISQEHPGVSVLLGLVARAVEGLADQGATMLHIATGSVHTQQLRRSD
jgi:hypothetical protein